MGSPKAPEVNVVGAAQQAYAQAQDAVTRSDLNTDNWVGRSDLNPGNWDAAKQMAEPAAQLVQGANQELAQVIDAGPAAERDRIEQIRNFLDGFGARKKTAPGRSALLGDGQDFFKLLTLEDKK